MGYNTKNYREQGGEKWVVGGELEIVSGGEVDVVGSLKISGTAVTSSAAEINQLDASVVGAASKIKKINMKAADFADNTEVGTGWSLPEGAVVKNVFVNVNTKEDAASTKTIDVGTDSADSGDADGYLAGLSVAAAGLVKGTLLNDGQTLGELLYVDESGTGELVPEIDIASGEKEITVTAGDSGGFTQVDFDIFIEYIEVA